MIEELLAGVKIAGQLGTTRMTRPTHEKHFLARDALEVGVARLVCMLLLPGIVAGHRPVAGFAANPHFRHGCAITVGAFLVIFIEAGIMTGGAHAVPGHPTPGPMAPFSRFAVFLAVNIKPLFLVRI